VDVPVRRDEVGCARSIASGGPISDPNEETAARRSDPVLGPGWTKAPNSAPDVPEPAGVPENGFSTSTMTRSTTAATTAAAAQTDRLVIAAQMLLRPVPPP